MKTDLIEKLEQEIVDTLNLLFEDKNLIETMTGKKFESPEEIFNDILGWDLGDTFDNEVAMSVLSTMFTAGIVLGYKNALRIIKNEKTN